MDPLSVLSVVAATVQFVDFAAKLISQTFKIHVLRSGELCDKHYFLIATKLRELNEDIKSSSTAAIQATVIDQNESDLLQLCDGCDEVARQLLDALSKLERSKSKEKEWGSFRIALMSIWKDDEVDRLERRLSGYQQQISLHILWGMREQLKCGLDNLAQEQIHTREEIVQLIGERREWKDGVIAAIAADPSPEVKLDVFEESQDRFARLICRELYFASILNREERIPDAHKATFEWIFHPPTAEQPAWADFGEWLESDSSIYWITGKAGAGKSTLMKFIGHDKRTTQMLTKSAGDRRLATARFYFWNSGAKLQMTQEGLLRTLTHDILQQCNDLAIKAFPHRWELFTLFGIFDDQRIDCRELQQRLDHIIKADLSTQFVFFIDGLDEFIEDRSDLAAYAKQLSASANTKVCVSSRPWNEFEDAFASTPSLRVEDLSYPDIIRFIESNFDKSPGYAELRAENEEEAKNLLHRIASKSSGVFLWVSIVVKSLLVGLTNGESFSTLRDRLDALPPDLEQLFQKMLDQIHHEHREGASRLFQIVRAALAPPTVITLSWADEDDPNLPFDRPVKPLSVVERDGRSRRLRRRLNSHCRGLMEAEIHSLAEGTVEFIHRTVKDFLYQDEVWSTLRSYTPTSFDPEEALCCSYLLQLKSSDDKSGLKHGSIGSALQGSTASSQCDLLVQFVRYTHRLYTRTGDAQLQLYDELEKSGKDIFGTNGGCVSTDGVCWCEGPVDHDDGPFLSLAVVLHIIPYVNARLTSLPTHKAKNPAGHSIFQIAVLAEEIDTLSPWKDAFCYADDRYELLRSLIAHGADPKLSTDPRRPSAWKDLLQKRERSRLEMRTRGRPLSHDPRWYCRETTISELQREMRKAQLRMYLASFVRKFEFQRRDGLQK